MKKDAMEKYCKYCQKAAALSEDDTMLCSKKGVVAAGYHCAAFRYDPLKRTPKRLDREPTLEFVEV